MKKLPFELKNDKERRDQILLANRKRRQKKCLNRKVEIYRQVDAWIVGYRDLNGRGLALKPWQIPRNKKSLFNIFS